MWLFVFLVDLRKIFKSACMGQEFVFEENEAVLDCAKEIIVY